MAGNAGATEVRSTEQGPSLSGDALPKGEAEKPLRGIHTLVSQCAYLGLRPLTMSK